MDLREAPEGLSSHPLDMTLGRFSRCEICALWFPEKTIEFTLGKDRCPHCRDRVLRGGSSGQALLI
jgi:hypothetical protein